MKRFIIICSAILSVSLQLAVSQGYNTKSGYIVALNNDTVRGLFMDRQNLKESIYFSAADKKDFKEFKPEGILSFSFSDGRIYRPVTDPSDSLATQKYFMQLLVEGRITLYHIDNEYFVASKSDINYLIDKKPDVIKRIEDEQTGGVRTIVLEDKKYIGTIRVLVQDCPSVFKKIDNLSYDVKSITRIVGDYNKTMDPDVETKVHNNPARIKLKLGVRGSIFSNDMVNYPANGRYHDENFEAKTCFSGSLLLNISPGRKFSLQPEIAFTQRKSHLYRENEYGDPEDITWDLTYLELPVNIYYTFPTKKISPFLLAGGMIGTKIKDDSVIESIYVSLPNEMDTEEFGFRVGTGFSYKKRNGEVLFRLEYYFEQATTNVYATAQRYHNNAHAVSAVFFFY
jgi:hypothetical protein